MAKIMVVDDEKDTAELISLILQKDSHTVWTASSGTECLSLLTEQTPDLIVMDVAMPEMDGYTLCSHLSADSATRDLPVLVVSGRESLRDTFQMFTSVVDFIPKPFDVKELRKRVSEILVRRGVK